MSETPRQEAAREQMQEEHQAERDAEVSCPDCTGDGDMVYNEDDPSFTCRDCKGTWPENEIETALKQKDCDHDLEYTGDRDSDGSTVYEEHRCTRCNAQVTRVFTHTHNIETYATGETEEVEA